MALKKWYVNIICDELEQPYKVIVTDGVTTCEIPVENTPLKMVKKAMYQLFNVKALYWSIVSEIDPNDPVTDRN